MTDQEEIEIDLYTVLSTRTTYWNIKDFNEATKDILVEGSYGIKQNLIDNGLIYSGTYYWEGTQRQEQGYAISEAGKRRLIYLTRMQKKERRNSQIAFWTLIAAIIAAVAAIVVPLMLQP